MISMKRKKSRKKNQKSRKKSRFSIKIFVNYHTKSNKWINLKIKLSQKNQNQKIFNSSKGRKKHIWVNLIVWKNKKLSLKKQGETNFCRKRKIRNLGQEYNKEPKQKINRIKKGST